MNESQSHGSYSPAQRVRLCLTCGAALEAPLAGGDLTCGRCSTAVSIPPRDLTPLGEPPGEPLGEQPAAQPADAGASGERGATPPTGGTAEQQQARLAMLRKQVQQYNRGNRYATAQAPEGYETLAKRVEADADTLEAAQQAFRKAIARCAQQPNAQHERAVYWLTWKLKNIHVQQNLKLETWPVIHTALDVLTDAGYQHLMRTMAANQARKAGELQSAEAWLALCDPVPRILDLDSAYRTSRALLHLAQGQPEAALARVGLGVFDVPFAPNARMVVGAIRVTALEELGRGFEAEQAFRELESAIIGQQDALLNMLRPDSVFAAARRTRARVKQQEGATDSLGESDEMLPPGGKRLAGAVIMALCALGAVAAGVYQVQTAFAYKGWKPTKGHIDEVVTTEIRAGGEDRAGVGVRYTYRVDGKTHQGQNVEPDARHYVYTHASDAEKRAASLRAKRDLTIYYNPDKPSESALERAWVGELVLGIVAFAVCAVLLLMTWLLIKSHRKRHCAHQQWKAREGAAA